MTLAILATRQRGDATHTLRAEPDIHFPQNLGNFHLVIESPRIKYTEYLTPAEAREWLSVRDREGDAVGAL